jgi:hypothetical protein
VPARISAKVKDIRGTRRRDREPKQPARPGRGRARVPASLSLAEMAAFRELEAGVRATGMATKSFGLVLEGAAVVLAAVRRHATTVTTEGGFYTTTNTNGGPKVLPHPAAAQLNTSLRLLRTYLSVLGLTPMDVGRVDRSVAPQEEDTDGEFLFGKRRALGRVDRAERYFK